MFGEMGVEEVLVGMRLCALQLVSEVAETQAKVLPFSSLFFQLISLSLSCC